MSNLAPAAKRGKNHLSSKTSQPSATARAQGQKVPPSTDFHTQFHVEEESTCLPKYHHRQQQPERKDRQDKKPPITSLHCQPNLESGAWSPEHRQNNTLGKTSNVRWTTFRSPIQRTDHKQHLPASQNRKDVTCQRTRVFRCDPLLDTHTQPSVRPHHTWDRSTKQEHRTGWINGE